MTLESVADLVDQNIKYLINPHFTIPNGTNGKKWERETSDKTFALEEEVVNNGKHSYQKLKGLGLAKIKLVIVAVCFFALVELSKEFLSQVAPVPMVIPFLASRWKKAHPIEPEHRHWISHN